MPKWHLWEWHIFSPFKRSFRVCWLPLMTIRTCLVTMTFSKTQWHKMSANYGHASLAEVSTSHLLLQGGGGGGGVQLLSCVWLFVTLWTAAHQDSLSFTISWSLLKLRSVESVMPSNNLILCYPLLLPSVFPRITRRDLWISQTTPWEGHILKISTARLSTGGW